MACEIHEANQSVPSFRIPNRRVGLKSSDFTQEVLSWANRGLSGFIGSDLDKSLKDCGANTLLYRGFNTTTGVVFLLDETYPQGTNEFPDTKDEVRIVMTRLIGDYLSYSSNCN